MEDLYISTKGDLNVTGNDLDNMISGSAGRNVINAGAGDDTIFSGGGDDWLDGGAGADLFFGGKGSTNFVFDNAGDRVTAKVLMIRARMRSGPLSVSIWADTAWTLSKTCA